MNYCKKAMKRYYLMAVAAMMTTMNVSAQEDTVQTYSELEQMPWLLSATIIEHPATRTYTNGEQQSTTDTPGTLIQNNQ